MDENEKLPPTVKLAGDAPAPEIKPRQLLRIAQHLEKIFEVYESDRRIAEIMWMRNLRQILGKYDPELERTIPPDRSRAYPRVTRLKVLSLLARVMNLMFPGNERNWTLKASPSPEIPPEDVMQELQTMMQKDQEQNVQTQPSDEMVDAAVEHVAERRADKLAKLIDDQLAELGGSQESDYVRLNRKVAKRGIEFGVGYLHGPHVRKVSRTRWTFRNGQPTPMTEDLYKPQFDALPVWDVYIDMSANSISEGEGYFIRKVLSKPQLRKLADRDDFFREMVLGCIKEMPNGNFQPKTFETQLRELGVNQVKAPESTGQGKFEILCWFGPIGADMLEQAGVPVPEGKKGDFILSEIWMIGNKVIKADLDPWEAMGEQVNRLHSFVFSEDDTSPIGEGGLPSVIRDSTMSIAAATRMTLDNASVVCGPNLEVNLDMLDESVDPTSVHAYKTWPRWGTGADANITAVRNIPIDSHIPELLSVIDTFNKFADQESFVGPATGGDMERGPSEPMRTAAGASMIRGDAALPFKDIVRNFDTFTQSVINSLVTFNRVFNPNEAPQGDYNVVARGATSLVAKEIKGIQVDQLASTMSPEERIHVDERKLVEQRFKTRDLDDLLVSEEEANRRKAAQQQSEKEARDSQLKLVEAEIREVLSSAFKNVTQGQKNAAAADSEYVGTVLNTLETGVTMDATEKQSTAALITAATTADNQGTQDNTGSASGDRPPAREAGQGQG